MDLITKICVYRDWPWKTKLKKKRIVKLTFRMKIFILTNMVRVSETLLNRAVGMLQTGTSQRRTAELLGMSRSQVNRAWIRFQVNDSPSYVYGGGRQRTTQLATDRFLVRRVLRERTVNSTILQRQLENLNVRISSQTIRNRLREANLASRRPARHPRWTGAHRQARLRFALNHQNWGINEWSHCLFTDESRFCLFPDDRRVKVWRRRGERFVDYAMVEYVPYGGASLMVWAGISADFRTELVILDENMNGNVYLQQILRPIVVPRAQNVGNNFIYMDDNARPHRARIVNEFFYQNGINRMWWPALSSDLNPIEQIWDVLQRRISSRNHHPDTLRELREALVEEWNQIPNEIINNLVQSMPQRCREVITSRGGPTHY